MRSERQGCDCIFSTLSTRRVALGFKVYALRVGRGYGWSPAEACGAAEARSAKLEATPNFLKESNSPGSDGGLNMRENTRLHHATPPSCFVSSDDEGCRAHDSAPVQMQCPTAFRFRVSRYCSMAPLQATKWGAAPSGAWPRRRPWFCYRSLYGYAPPPA